MKSFVQIHFLVLAFLAGGISFFSDRATASDSLNKNNPVQGNLSGELNNDSISILFHQAFNKGLYNLDDTVESAVYRKLSSIDARKKMLRQAFKQKKLNMIRKGLLLNIPDRLFILGLSAAWRLFPVVAIQNGFSSWVGALAKNFSNVDNHPREALTNFRLMSQVLYLLWQAPELIKIARGVYALKTEVALILGLKDMEDPIVDLEMRFAENYHYLRTRNLPLFKEIVRIFVEYRQFQLPNPLLQVDRQKLLVNTIHFLEIALSVPLVAKPLDFDEDTFEDLFEFYDSKVKEDLRHIVFRQYLLSKNIRPPEKSFPIFFVGAPGVGKTVAAENLAKTLNLPIARVTLDGATIDNLIGRVNESEFEPGRLLTALNAASKKTGVGFKSGNFENMIFFIDEFDRVLNYDDPDSRAVLSFMLKVLDPNNRKFYSPFLKAEVSLPSTILLAGNYEIKDEALSNRFDIVHFTGYPNETKWKIAQKYTIPQTLKMFSLNEEDLEKQDWQKLQEIVMKDKDKGMRQVEKGVMKYFEKNLMDTMYPEDEESEKRSE